MPTCGCKILLVTYYNFYSEMKLGCLAMTTTLATFNSYEVKGF